MTGIGQGAGVGGRGPGAAPLVPGSRSPAPDDAERLRDVARQLEGVFVEQLFKAMRETVPEGGAVEGGSGEAMFTGMLDQELSGQVPARWERGLSEALYRQLRGRSGAEEPPPPPPGAAPPPAAAADRSSLSPAAPILGS